jgi:hypothetical protein
MNKKETPTSHRKPNKDKEQDHLKKTSLGPLRQGQRLKLEKPQRAPPAHMQAPPGPMQLLLNECMQNTTWKQGSCNNSAPTGQTGPHHRSDRCATCEQGQHTDRSDRWPRPVRAVHTRAQKWLETTWKPSKCIQQAISSSNFSPLLATHESSQKCKTFNLELL